MTTRIPTRIPTRRSLLLGLATVATLPSLLASRAAYAQTAVRQLTIVVGFPAGGATDIVARLLADGMRGSYADTVIVENRSGGAGRIGTAHVKNAPADGSVMLCTAAFPLAIFPHIYKTLPYDSLADFVPVASTTRSGFALSVGPGVPDTVRTLKEFVAWCKAKPGDATYGAPAGSGQHFAGALFARQAGIPMRMISYKGGAPVVTDLLGGHIASAVNPIPEVLPYAKEGKLRILATTTNPRSRFLPDTPTMSELGYEVVFQDWSGLLAPAGTPKEIVARANAAAGEALRASNAAATLDKLGSAVDLNSPDQFAAMYRQTWERYRDVVKSTGFTAEE